MIISSGSSQTFTLEAHNQLTVTSRGGTTVTGPSGLLGTVDGTSTFGSYSVDTEITIAAVGEDCNYLIAVPEAATFARTSSGSALVDPVTGENFLRGLMDDGVWMTCPSVFRLRITGTGTVTVDAKDSLGNITLAVASYTASGATDQIEFPYAGDNAVAIRATLTGTATAEVI